MQSGLPVLVAKNTSLIEIVGAGGILHDADDYHAFAEDILKLIANKELSQEMRAKGIEKAKEFSIQKNVKEFVEAFNSLE